MEDSKLINLWNAYDEKFNDSYLLIKKNEQDITQLKVKSTLSSMKPVKIFALLVGIVWVVVVGNFVANLFVYAYAQTSRFFLYSAAIQVVLTAIAIITYIYQLILISRVDITEPVLKTQETLVRLKTSTLWVTKILFLQLPLWTTFYLSEKMFVSSNIALLIFQAIVTLSFTYAALWLFFNIKFENRNKKWFRIIFNGPEWTPLMRSMEFMEQVEEYR